MELARVIVTTWKCLNFQRITMLAVDSVDTGESDAVFFVRGRDATFLPIVVPNGATVVRIVDYWRLELDTRDVSRRKRTVTCD